MAKRPGGVMVQGTEATQSQLIPFVAKWEEIGKKAQLGPILFCIGAFFVLEFFGSTKPISLQMADGAGNLASPRFWIYSSWFLIELAFLLTAFSFYFIYRVVGKNKSWWILLGAFAFTAYFLWLMQTQDDFGWLYDFFHVHLAGEKIGAERSLMQWVVGTGFFEEFVKAIPVFILAILTSYMSPSLRAKIGVEEPLDGILIGCAAAGGFAIAETLLQYLSHALVQEWIAIGAHVLKGFNLTDKQVLSDPQLFAYLRSHPKADIQDILLLIGQKAADTTIGVPNLITRSIDQAFGHMAYSGYFGYFIGLSVLKPQQRWKILAIGLVSAAIPHALWDWIQDFDMPPLTAAVAVFSYAVLAAAILKAREISPNRAVLQPSLILGTGLVQPSTNVPVAVRVSPVMNVPVPAPPPRTSPMGAAGASVEGNGYGNRLRIGSRYLVIVAGLRLLEHQVPGLVAQMHGGPVAEVTRNPNDPSVLGLTNLSTAVWEAMSASGTRRQIGTGQTIKLAAGTRIDFGSIDGEVT
jgi:RsiW-degrading membrane proteinase PrsW (M82 family)